MNEQNQSMEPGAQEFGAPEELNSGWWRLQGIFFEPGETFRQIARKPNVLLPLLAMALVGFAANFFVLNQIGYENILRKQIGQSPQIQNLPAEQREEIISGQINSPIVRTLTYVGPMFGIILMFVIAGLLAVGVRLQGSDTTYKHVLSVTCHSYFAYGIVSSALLCVVVAVASDKSEIDLNDAVLSHLGFLVDKFDSPVMYNLASSLNLLSFYVIYLLALGLSSLGRKPSLGGALGVVLFWWLLYVAAKVGLTALFS